MQYNNLKHINKKYIKENPDHIDVNDNYVPDANGHYKWDSNDAIAFIVDPDLTEIYVGEWSHMDIIYDDIYGGDEDEVDNNMDNKWLRSNSFHGRLWTEPKIFSFWKQPTPAQLKKILSMLGDYAFTDKYDFINDFRIEVKDGVFVPIKRYINGGEDTNNGFDMKAIYNLSAEEKRKTPQMQAYMKNRGELEGQKFGKPNNSRYVTQAEYNYYKHYNMGESRNVNEVSEKDVSLKSFKVQETLNPKFWINNKLNSRVRLRLLDIADDFIDELNIKWVKPKDIVLTGSIANYNWSSYSDVDVHILVDYKKIFDKKDLVDDYFTAKKELWNETHSELTIYGFPVEIYVEDTNDSGTSSGVYSLNKNEWIKEPNDFQDAKLNEKYVKKYAAQIMTDIDNLIKKIGSESRDSKIEKLSNKLVKIFDKLKRLRKDGLKSKQKEFSSGNIIWKILRRTGYLEKIWIHVNKSYDKINSLTEKRNILDEDYYQHGQYYTKKWFDEEPEPETDRWGQKVQWIHIDPLPSNWKAIGVVHSTSKYAGSVDGMYVLCDMSKPKIKDFEKFKRESISINFDKDGKDGFGYFYQKFDYRNDSVEVFNEYKGTYYDMLFNGLTDEYRNELYDEFLSKCFVYRDYILAHHDSSVKITDGYVSAGHQANNWTKRGDWGAYFWLGKSSGGDQSNGGTYTYYCFIPISEIYFAPSNLEHIKGDMKAMATNEHPYVAGDWEKGNTIACQTNKPTKISFIRTYQSGQEEWFDGSWNKIEKPSMFK